MRLIVLVQHLLLKAMSPSPTHVFAPSVSSVASATLPHTQSDLTPFLNNSAAIMPSIRLEQGFTQGSQIGVFYDPLIAKLVVHGRDRTEALRVLRKALDEYRVVGVSTNIEFLRMLAGHEAFINGQVETGFISVCHLCPQYPQYSSFCRNIMTISFLLFQSLPLRSSRKQHCSWLSVTTRSIHLHFHPSLRGLHSCPAVLAETPMNESSPSRKKMSLRIPSQFTSSPRHRVISTLQCTPLHPASLFRL